MGLREARGLRVESVDSNRFGNDAIPRAFDVSARLEEPTCSIQSLSSVQMPTCTLGIAKPEWFFAKQKPSASVLLTLHPARTLDRTQVAGIVHLVASSVPEMNPSAVSVVDDSGKLLSGSSDASGGNVF